MSGDAVTYGGTGLTVVAGERAVVLVAAEPEADLIRALWSVVRAGASLPNLIEALAGHGVARLPDFGLVSWIGAHATLLVRGRVTAEVHLAGGDAATVSAEGVTTWLERGFTDTRRVLLAGGGGAGGPRSGLPLVAGVARASAVSCELALAPGRVVAVEPLVNEPTHTRGRPQLPSPEPATSAPQRREPPRPDSREPARQPVAPDQAEQPPPVRGLTPLQRAVHVRSGEPTPPVGSTPPTDPPPLAGLASATRDVPGADTAPGAGELPGVNEAPGAGEWPGAGDVSPVGSALFAPPQAPEHVVPLVDGVPLGELAPQVETAAPADHIWLGTPVQSAAGEDESQPGWWQRPAEPAWSAASVDHASPDPSWTSGPEAFGWEPLAEPARPTGGLMDRIPTNPDQGLLPSGTNTWAFEPDRPRLGDHDNHTVPRQEPGGNLPAAGAAATSAPNRSVRAVICPSGHPNRPADAACRVCRAPLDENQLPVDIPAPTLGMLRLSTGQSVPLVRAVTVVGREPRAQGPDAALIAPKGATGNISRLHAEIRVREWTVEVVDLGSTNGTRVSNPIGDPVQLEPGQPVPLLPGGVIDLAGEVSIQFEVSE